MATITPLMFNHDYTSTIKDNADAFVDQLVAAMTNPSDDNWYMLRDFGVVRINSSRVGTIAIVGNATNVSREDGGMAMIVELDDNTEEGMFVKLQSWSEKCDHAELERFVNKRVRITVEVVE